MKKVECEEKATEAQCDSVDKEEEEDVDDEDTKQKTNKENQQHPVSVPSPSPSITSHSLPGNQIPTLRLHSLSDSPESSISDDHRSVSHGVPPVVNERVRPPLVTAHRFQVEPTVVTKVDPGAEEGFVGVKDVERDAVTGGGGGGNRRLRPDVSSLLGWKKVAALSKLLLGVRITAFMFCLVSFSVLAADRERGWAQDSFYLYKEFRYSLSVNVFGFVYSGLQICDLVLYLITRKHIVEHALRGYFTFALDQILTYLLMSASSSAATRAYDWESNWGEDKFPYMANASVALSFIAFVAFALASLVSGSIICRFR